MNLSDLLGGTVVTAEGDLLGEVSDVRLVQDGPLLAGIVQALRVDGVLVGRTSLAERLGFVHGGVQRPALLARLLRALSGQPRLVAWDDVDHWDQATRRLHLRAGAEPSVARP
jgi:hypothetical protein